MAVFSPSNAQFKNKGILLAAGAALFLSTSPIFVRWAAPLSPYEITAWRVFVAALSVGTLATTHKKWPKITCADLPKFLLFGLITAIHFLGYIASLSFTTIAHSLTIVYTAPVFVALFSKLFLREPISGRKWGGVAIVVAGIALLAGFEPSITPKMLVGDGLALVSAITYGLYSVAGRSQREGYPLLTYAFFVYLLAAVWMAPVAMATTNPGGYGLRQVLSLLALGVVPLGLGHTMYNAALRHMNATYTNLIASQEVTGGILLGIIFLSEVPGPTAIAGVAVTLVGIVIVLL
ncbi:MAG: DMT family transporter [Anaerolineae bacterium]